MAHDQFHALTIFKCDYNAGIIILFTYLMLSKQYLYAYIKSDWNDVFLWTLQKILELSRILRYGRPLQMESFPGDSPKNLGKLSINGKSPLQEIRKNFGTLYREATFAIIYLCLLLSTGLNLSIKYVSYYCLKIFVVFLKKTKIAEHGIIWNFHNHMSLYDP